MEIVRWIFIVFLILYILGGIYLVTTTVYEQFKWEQANRKFWKQQKQQEEVEEKKKLKYLAEKAIQKELSQKQFQDTIKKQIEENEK